MAMDALSSGTVLWRNNLWHNNLWHTNFLQNDVLNGNFSSLVVEQSR